MTEKQSWKPAHACLKHEGWDRALTQVASTHFIRCMLHLTSKQLRENLILELLHAQLQQTILEGQSQNVKARV